MPVRVMPHTSLSLPPPRAGGFSCPLALRPSLTYLAGMRRMLTRDEHDRLVRETALGFHAPEDLPLILGIPAQAIDDALQSPLVQRDIQILQREFAEQGERFRLAARKHAEALPYEMTRIITDPEAPIADRIRAADQLVKWAGLSRTDENDGRIVIQIAGAESIRAAREANPWGQGRSSADKTDPASAPTSRFAPVEIEMEPTDG